MEIRSLARKIRERKSIMRQESRIVKQSCKPVIPRTAPARVRERSVSNFRNKMEDLGVSMEGTDNVNIIFKFILPSLLFSCRIVSKKSKNYDKWFIICRF